MNYDDMEQAGPYFRRFFNKPDQFWYYYHQCPACDETHQYVVGAPGQHWGFNNDFQKPSFTPSMLIATNAPRSPEEKLHRVTYTQCHYFVRNGMIEYCADSPHALAGKSVPLPEWLKI